MKCLSNGRYLASLTAVTAAMRFAQGRTAAAPPPRVSSLIRRYAAADARHAVAPVPSSFPLLRMIGSDGPSVVNILTGL